MSQMLVADPATAGPGAAEAEKIISVRGLIKKFRRKSGEIVHAVDDVSFDVRAGEMVVLLGPSGCGKTTLLRCIAGLEDPDAGTVELEGRRVFAAGSRPVPPETRGIGMMFQSYALWPHMSVAKNVAYPVAARKMNRAEAQRQVDEILEIVGVANLRDQYPPQLSGGQQQRVALARSLVARPRIMLFDEPLSNVDAKVREQLRYEILEMQKKLGFSGIYVTHDQDEAMKMATNLAVLKHGKIEQLDSPAKVYGEPLTRYVADFVGVVNRWRVDNVRGPDTGDTVRVDVDQLGTLEVGREQAGPLSDIDGGFGVIIRPEAVSLSLSSTGAPNERTGVVRRVTFAGAHSEYLVELANAGGTLTAWAHNVGAAAPRESDRVFVQLPPRNLRVVTD